MRTTSKPASRANGRDAGKCVALYCRFSVALHGQTENVEDQEHWGREYAARNLADLPVRVYRDNGKTAARDDVVRDDYERLKADVAAGKVAAVWATETTRLERRVIPWLQLLSDFDSHGAVIHTSREGIMKADDVGSEVRGVFAHDEIRKLRKRAREKAAIRAEQGRPAGGSMFGYLKGTDDQGRKTLVVDDPENCQAEDHTDCVHRAPLVRWMAAEVQSGRNAYNIARELRERGVRGVRGAVIADASQVSTILESPTIAGLRAHETDEGVQVRPAIWEPILTEDTWRDVCAVLEAQRREAQKHSAKGGQARRKYILSGLARCPRCDEAFYGCHKSQSNGREHVFIYRCVRGCRQQIKMDVTDVYVLDQLAGKLSELADLHAEVTADDSAGRRDELHSELSAIDARRRNLAHMWGRGELGDADWAEARAGMNARRDEIQAELVTITSQETGDDPDAVRDALQEARRMATDDSLDTSERRGHVETLRAICGEWIDRVVIEPANGRRDPIARIRIEGEGWD